jgi:hypothetical protein
MKRTMLYHVSKDGHITPIFASSQPIGRNTRRVWRRWVRRGYDLILCTLGVAAIVLLPGLCEWLAEVVTR